MTERTGGILVLDFGGQYAQLIARRVRDARVFSVVLPPDATEERIRRWAPAGIILSGGPQSVYEEGAPLPRADPRSFGVPVLGLCYGMQWMAHAGGGEVVPFNDREYGRAVATVATDSELFAGLDAEQTVWMNHGDSVLQPPTGFRVIGSTRSSPVAAIEDADRKLYGLQFHPEVRHTEHGSTILENFLFRVCGMRPDWTIESFRRDAVDAIRAPGALRSGRVRALRRSGFGGHRAPAPGGAG